MISLGRTLRGSRDSQVFDLSSRQQRAPPTPSPLDACVQHRSANRVRNHDYEPGRAALGDTCGAEGSSGFGQVDIILCVRSFFFARFLWSL